MQFEFAALELVPQALRKSEADPFGSLTHDSTLAACRAASLNSFRSVEAGLRAVRHDLVSSTDRHHPAFMEVVPR